MSVITEPGFGRLLWKEWRIARSFAIVLAVIGVGLLAMAAFLGRGSGDSYTIGMAALATGLPLIALAGMVATAFAAEHENGTGILQRSLPTSVSSVVLSKLIVAVVVSLILFAILAFTAVALAAPDKVDLGNLSVVVAAIEMTAWGMLISMLSRRPLVALVLAAMLAVVTAFAMVSLADYLAWTFGWTGTLWNTQSQNNALRMVMRLIAVSVVAALAVRSSGAWFDDRAADWGRAGQGLLGRDTDALASRSEKVATGALARLGRLVWCQYRSAPGIWIGLTAVTLLMVYLIRRDEHGVALFLTLGGSLFGGITLGLSSAEKRFLFAQPIRPRFHWLATLVLPGAIVALFCIALMMMDWRRREYWLLCFGPLAGFAVGQLISRFAKSGLIGFGLSLLTGVLVIFWISFAMILAIPFWVAVLPLIVFAFLATFLTAKGWLYQWDDRAHRRWLAVCIGVPAVLILALVAAFRAYEIPAVTAQQIAALSLPDLPRQDQGKTAAFLRMIDPKIHGRLGASWGAGMYAYDPIAEVDVDVLSEALQENRIALPTDTDRVRIRHALGKLSLDTQLAARRAIADGDSQAAQKYLQSLIRLKALAQDVGYGYFQQDNAWLILQWATMPSTEPAAIQGIIDQLTPLVPDKKSALRSQALQSHFLQQLAANDSDFFNRIWDPTTRRGLIVTSWMPWERQRLKRFVEHQIIQSTQSLRRMADIMERNQRPDSEDSFVRQTYIGDPHLLVPTYEFQLQDAPTFLRSVQMDRALIVRMAILLWQKTHDGRLPSAITDLSDIVDDDVMIDPAQGQPFLIVAGQAAQVAIAEGGVWDGDYWEQIEDVQAALVSPQFAVEIAENSTLEHPRLKIVGADSSVYDLADLLARDTVVDGRYAHGALYYYRRATSYPIPTLDIESPTLDIESALNTDRQTISIGDVQDAADD
ncbi:ABC-2 transporter permease [Crateriforma conspicua]|uniref:ABC-2 family transporter protein n=1 Tax=Crateriforma conspicua TaxID=2527996 RepID=A0A5C5Y5V0_9PLAN|nr:hypothetical protein [Crateriforma conspicua]TWT71116.1 ABC-2 family transporter protein [Crateriforma conspicua]